MLFSKFRFGAPSSASAIVSLFLLFLGATCWAQTELTTGVTTEPGAERARSETFPLSVPLLEEWKSFPGDPKVSGEILFLQSPEDGALDATLSLLAFPLPKNWDDLLRRQQFQLVVELGAQVQTDEALTLKGARGHKWVYRGHTSAGQPKVYYRLYLSLPASVGPRRLLVFHGVADADQESLAVSTFNDLVRGLNWGNESQVQTESP